MSKFEFVNLHYKPKSSDLICLFRVEPAKRISVKEAANTIALESSIGTWTDVSTKRKLTGKET